MAITAILPEVWLRGPLPGMSPLLQPIAHALLQAREELVELLHDFPAELLNERPLGLGSVGFHLQHLSGVLDRLFTYARGESLNETQRGSLAAEPQPLEADASIADLVARFHQQVAAALAQLRLTPDVMLPDMRGVGRAQVPSTVMGLYTHAAEHTMRHLGQLLVTVRVVMASR
jgi:uncharacterized damage-inducible protein DinB